MSLPCPDWCRGAHDAPEHPVDVTHTSEQISLSIPMHGGDSAILRAQIVFAPFSGEHRAPTVTLWPDELGDAQMGMLPDDLDAVMSLLLDYLAALQGMRDRLAMARAVHEATREI